MQIGLKTLTFLEIVNYSLRILANATFSVALKNKGVGLPTIRKPKPYGNGLHKRFHLMHFTVLIASIDCTCIVLPLEMLLLQWYR
jgi:hypothetical protein